MVEYDPSLEGNDIPSIPLDDNSESERMRKVKMFMREMVSKLRHQQEVSITPGKNNPEEELAFINSLLLLHQWSKPGINILFL